MAPARRERGEEGEEEEKEGEMKRREKGEGVVYRFMHAPLHYPGALEQGSGSPAQLQA